MNQEVNMLTERPNLPGEIWKPIPGQEGRYDVSNFGRIWHYPARYKYGSLTLGHMCNVEKGNYMSFSYTLALGSSKRAHWLVHRLVAEVFIPNPDNLPIVQHIDRDTLNNKVSNLRWVTKEDIMQDPITRERASAAMKRYCRDKGGLARLNAYNKEKCRSVRCIESGVVYPSCNEAARALGLRYSTVAASLKYARDGFYKRVSTYKGKQVLHFVYANQEDPKPLDWRGTKIGQKSYKPVICLETGDVWNSVYEAAAANGRIPRIIYAHCRLYKKRKQFFTELNGKPVMHYAYLKDVK